MDEYPLNDLELPAVEMTDAEIAAELYRYLVAVVGSEPQPSKPPVTLSGPN